MQPTSSYMISHRLSVSFLRMKRKRDGETNLENVRELLSLRGVVPPSLLVDGGIGLDCVECHTRAPAKPCESGVYDNSKVATCRVSEDPVSPAPAEGIHCGVHGIL
jgi:hypothetical protein